MSFESHPGHEAETSYTESTQVGLQNLLALVHLIFCTLPPAAPAHLHFPGVPENIAVLLRTVMWGATGMP